MDIQRRKHNRYHLRLPVTFWWRDGQQMEHKGEGLTRDISVAAAFIMTASPPPLEANIKLNVSVPPPHRAGVPLGIHGEGHVVRVEDNKGEEVTEGFAMVGKRFVMRRGEEYR